jgi:hypothetical protein
MPFLRTKTALEHTMISAAYQLGGIHLQSFRIPGKNLFKWLKAMSTEFANIESALNDFVDGRIITKSTTFLPEWEKSAGIPDDDFPAIGTAEERRRHVVTKLASEGVSTADELEWLCSLMGFSVKVYPGHYFWTNPDSRVSFSTERESRFTVVFEVDFDESIPEVIPEFFPVPFPWTFRSNNYNVLQSFMLSVIPSNCNGLWINADDEAWISVPDSFAEAVISNPVEGEEIVNSSEVS